MKKKIFTGAALGSLVGALAIALFPKRKEFKDILTSQGGNIGSKAKEYANVLLSGGKLLARTKQDHSRLNYLKGGIAGLLVGAGLTLFLTPKNGKQIRLQISKMYATLFGKTQEVIKEFKNNSHPFFSLPNNHPVKKKKRVVKSKST